MKKIFLFLALFASGLGFYACKSSKEKLDDPTQGEILIVSDESLQPLVDAQIQGYEAEYPNAKINVKYVPEQKAINLMLNDSAKVAVVTRELNAKELEIYKAGEIPYTPAIMALDGVALITNRANKDSLITLDELKKMFNGEIRKDTKLVFDNSSSSNLNYMIQKLGIKDVKQANIFAANGNIDVINYINKNTNAIGVIGLNWISDSDDKTANKLRQSVRVMSIANKANPTVKDYYQPNALTLSKRAYPLERNIYLQVKDARFGLAQGFIRYCCFQIGQLVVEKMGLLPNYKFPREMLLNKQSQNISTH